MARWALVACAVAAGTLAAAALAVGGLDANSPGNARPVAKAPAIVWAGWNRASASDHAGAVAAMIARGPVDRMLHLGTVYEHGLPERPRRSS